MEESRRTAAVRVAPTIARSDQDDAFEGDADIKGGLL